MTEEGWKGAVRRFLDSSLTSLSGSFLLRQKASSLPGSVILYAWFHRTFECIQIYASACSTGRHDAKLLLRISQGPGKKMRTDNNKNGRRHDYSPLFYFHMIYVSLVAFPLPTSPSYSFIFHHPTRKKDARTTLALTHTTIPLAVDFDAKSRLGVKIAMLRLERGEFDDEIGADKLELHSITLNLPSPRPKLLHQHLSLGSEVSQKLLKF